MTHSMACPGQAWPCQTYCCVAKASSCWCTTGIRRSGIGLLRVTAASLALAVVRALSAAWSLLALALRFAVAADCAAVAGALAGLAAAAGELAVVGEPGVVAGRPMFSPPCGSRCSVAVSRLPSTHSA